MSTTGVLQQGRRAGRPVRLVWRLVRASATALLIATSALLATAPAISSAAPLVLGHDVDGRVLVGRAAAVAPLQAVTGGTARIVTGARGAVTFIGADPAHPLTQRGSGDPGDIARRFIETYGTAFGVDQPNRELIEEDRTRSLSGVAVRFRQEHSGIPVLAGQVLIAVQSDGAITSATGGTAAVGDIATTPAISAAAAAATAIALTARDAKVDAATLTAATPELWIYDPELLHADGVPGARLVWRTAVRTPLGEVNQFVLIDARTGAVALSFDQVPAGKNREVCDNSNNGGLDETCNTPVLVEGGNVAAQNVEVRNAYNFAGATYDFYFNVLGRDSVDGAGMDLLSTVRYCSLFSDCPFPNAYWNGFQMVYGDTYASALDVVGHELTHGVTENTSALLYYGQPGAINESLSDVFGEIVQLANLPAGDPEQTAWLMGENLPVGAVRSMSNPGAYGDPDRMTSASYWATSDDDYGVHSNSGVNNKAAFLIAEGGVFNGYDMGAGIGITKTAQVYYQAQTTLLAEASDYLDLFHVLPQACNALVGIGTYGISAANCAIVNKAVLATEMNKPPTAAAVNMLLAKCPAGQVVSNLVFADDFSGGAPNWAYAGVPSDAAFTVDRIQSDAVGLVGPDLEVTATGNAHTAKPISIPATGTTYVQFTHAFQLDYFETEYYDGGRIGFSTTGPDGTYNDLTMIAGSSPVNGYNGVLTNYSGNTNPWSGQSAFVGDSPGFQTTQIDVSVLHGQSVNLGFFIATDESIGYGGWLIKDFSVYQCGAGTNGFTPITPCRVASTLPAPYTVGPRSTPLTAKQTFAVKVIGFSGDCNLPSSATSVSLNVTVVGAQGPGFVTVFPCDNARPNASSLNYVSGQTIPNAVISKVAADGTVCFYTLAATNLIVDINGYNPIGSGFVPLVPARLLETRPAGPGISTADGRFLSGGLRAAKSTTSLQVTARGRVPVDAAAAVLNVTVTGAAGSGFVTVFPCDASRPISSNLNFSAGQTIPNAVITKLAADGTVCLYTTAGTHLIVDVTGYYPAGSGFTPLVPARLMETRVGDSATTIDGSEQGIGVRTAGSIKTLQIGGRGGVPAGATAVVLNVTVTGPGAPGYVTVYPCDAARPTASNLNYTASQTIPNAVLTKLSATGTVCLYTLSSTHLVVDVAGYYTSS
jgi:Zn-dependent metalloprotease